MIAKNAMTFRKLYKMSDLNYNDIKPEKPLPTMSEKKVRKTTRFHEITRALSPKRKSTKLLLNSVSRRSISPKLRKTTFLKQMQNNPSINEKMSEDSQQNIEKNIKNIHQLENMRDKMEETRPFLEKKEDKNLEQMKFLKFRKILINSKNTRTDSIMGCGLMMSKALKNKEINFSSVSKMATINGKTLEKKEKNDFTIKESNQVLKYMQMPIINEVTKIEDFKEAFVRIHVIFLILFF